VHPAPQLQLELPEHPQSPAILIDDLFGGVLLGKKFGIGFSSQIEW
jgi:hypothetical protein